MSLVLHSAVHNDLINISLLFGCWCFETVIQGDTRQACLFHITVPISKRGYCLQRDLENADEHGVGFIFVI